MKFILPIVRKIRKDGIFSSNAFGFCSKNQEKTEFNLFELIRDNKTKKKMRKNGIFSPNDVVCDSKNQENTEFDF